MIKTKYLINSRQDKKLKRQITKTNYYNPYIENSKRQLGEPNKKKKIRCSFCKKLGHNIKSCKLKIEYYAEILIMIKNSEKYVHD
tara:strand:+ start:629 stop:883 length:255 start_codon:yes stop_codon:yes gene_type:complete